MLTNVWRRAQRRTRAVRAETDKRRRKGGRFPETTPAPSVVYSFVKQEKGARLDALHFTTTGPK